MIDTEQEKINLNDTSEEERDSLDYYLSDITRVEELREKDYEKYLFICDYINEKSRN